MCVDARRFSRSDRVAFLSIVFIVHFSIYITVVIIACGMLEGIIRNEHLVVANDLQELSVDLFLLDQRYFA